MREFNTYTTDERTARLRKEELEASILGEQPDRGADEPEPAAVPDSAEITFADAAKLYIAYRSPSKFDQQCIDRVISRIGAYKIADLRSADLHAMALALYPSASSATRNRNALRPATTILHHAADEGLCTWLRVKKFPEPPAKTRAVSLDTAAELIEAAAEAPTAHKVKKRRLKASEMNSLSKRKLFVLWIFYQGNRVSAILRTDWKDIDLDRKVAMMDIRKGKSEREKPLHEEVVTELLKVPPSERTGPVFPWRTRSGVRWLGKLLPGLNFTSHMGRHTHGSLLNAEGAGLRTIMDSLDHSDAKSSIRYQAVDVEIVRAATGKIRIGKTRK